MSPSQMINRPLELLARTDPINADALAGTTLSPDDIATVELAAGTDLYGLVTAHLAALPNTCSFTMQVGNKGSSCCDSGDEDDDSKLGRTACKGLGLGLFPFSFGESSLYALHQTLGEVVGTDCGATLLRSLVLISPTKSIASIEAFCNELIAKADATSGHKFTVFRFAVRHQYWHRSETVQARQIDSVVLPSSLKAPLIEDLDDFSERSTRAWYLRHGIPYKRSYLFWGAPGAGKTSLIQAIAGRYKRNVCYLSPSHPEMTDDALKSAVQRMPARSICVLEDVDALFGSSGRDKKASDKSALTFSGVLNALDGIGGADGQIFILTTNHRENLDPALLRNGRVDVHIEFTNATAEQMASLFIAFYPDAPTALATQFASGLTALLGERTVSMALLQHYFISMRKKSAQDAAAAFDKVIEEAEAHGAKLHSKGGATDKSAAAGGKEEANKEVDEANKEVTPAEGGEGSAKESEGGDEDDKGSAKAKKTSKSGREVHIHLHVD